MKDIAIICADVGSVEEKNFGWSSSLRKEGGNSLATLVAHVCANLSSGKPVALGFECPLYVLLAEDELFLTKARPGEGNRPWSAAAGSCALTTGLVQAAWVLEKIRKQLAQVPPVFLSWHEFCDAPAGLFLWEAYVTGKEKSGSHIGDARLAVEAFERGLPDPTIFNKFKCDQDVYSLLGAALLRTGWADDLRLLQQPCLVVSAADARNNSADS